MTWSGFFRAALNRVISDDSSILVDRFGAPLWQKPVTSCLV